MAHKSINRRQEFGRLIGTSAVMQQVYSQIEAAARTTAPVFVTGASGTGKNICAETIHKYSPRSSRPFITINCATIPPPQLEAELFGDGRDQSGAVDRAQGGTLLLDHLTEVPLPTQTKILRLFKEQSSAPDTDSTAEDHTNPRLISAVQSTLKGEISSARLRDDLYYRLHVLPITMPPLCQRGEDVIDIAQTLLRDYAAAEGRDFKTLAPETKEVFRAYSWPGNIRQLENLMRYITVMYDGSEVVKDMLPRDLTLGNLADGYSDFLDAEGIIRPLAEEERDIIERAIRICDGNIPRAAAALGIAPSTIYRKKSGWDQQ